MKTTTQTWPAISQQMTVDAAADVNAYLPVIVSISHTECYCDRADDFTCTAHLEGERFFQELAVEVAS